MTVLRVSALTRIVCVVSFDRTLVTLRIEHGGRVSYRSGDTVNDCVGGDTARDVALVSRGPWAYIGSWSDGDTRVRTPTSQIALFLISSFGPAHSISRHEGPPAIDPAPFADPTGRFLYVV